MNLTKKLLLALMAVGMLASVLLETAPAQTDHGAHTMPPPAAASSAPVEAYKAAMDKMHKAMMAVEYSGNADVDFARGMIPHHQAAVDMARIELEHGTDPEMRKLAEDVIAAQEAEIQQMQDWLAAHPAK